MFKLCVVIHELSSQNKVPHFAGLSGSHIYLAAKGFLEDCRADVPLLSSHEAVLCAESVDINGSDAGSLFARHLWSHSSGTCCGLA